jgi:hypothetical protein
MGGDLMETKVPVTEQALFQRIQRKLSKQGEKICKTRGMRARQNLGTYHIVNLYHNTIVNYRIEDLEDLARELGAISVLEYMVKMED